MCQFIWPSTTNALNCEYFCTAREAILLDFLSDPKRPLYMQHANTEGFNIKLSRYENKIIMTNNRRQETTYPKQRLTYSYTSVKDFFVAAEGQTYFEFKDDLAVYSHTNMITSYNCEHFQCLRGLQSFVIEFIGYQFYHISRGGYFRSFQKRFVQGML